MVYKTHKTRRHDRRCGVLITSRYLVPFEIFERVLPKQFLPNCLPSELINQSLCSSDTIFKELCFLSRLDPLLSSETFVKSDVSLRRICFWLLFTDS